MVDVGLVIVFFLVDVVVEDKIKVVVVKGVNVIWCIDVCLVKFGML